jgi:hypothetical protein
VQSQRLRRSSRELTLLFDLSSLLLENHPTGKQLLAKVLGHVVPHLEGTWSASAHLYNVFNDEMETVARLGEFDFETSLKKALASETESRWIDHETYFIALPGEKKPSGYLLFHSSAELDDQQRSEHSRTLTTVARLLTSALENINFKTEEALRNRLKKTGYGTSI